MLLLYAVGGNVVAVALVSAAAYCMHRVDECLACCDAILVVVAPGNGERATPLAGCVDAGVVGKSTPETLTFWLWLLLQSQRNGRSCVAIVLVATVREEVWVIERAHDRATSCCSSTTR